MSEKKERLGFETSATKLEDRFIELTQLVKGRRFKWSGSEAISKQYVNDLNTEITELEKSKTKNVPLLHERKCERQLWLLVSVLSRLGLDIVYNQERLNNIEKIVDNLRPK